MRWWIVVGLVAVSSAGCRGPTRQEDQNPEGVNARQELRQNVELERREISRQEAVGRIEAVGQDRIVMTEGDRRLDLQANEDTEVYRGGERVQWNELREGYDVRATYEADDSGWRATRFDVLTSEEGQAEEASRERE